jgi:hypothetical protein
MSASGGGGSRSRQYAIDPAASARMAAVEERLAAMQENEYAFGKEVFQPYEREMVASNRALLPINEQLMRGRLEQGITDMREDAPIRREMRSQTMEGLRLSRPVLGEYFKEAVDGIDIGQRKKEAVAGVEHEYSRMMPGYDRSLTRRGMTSRASDLRKIGISKAKAKAGASTLAERTAKAERFGRLGQALNVNQGFRPSLDSTAYAQGALQLGNYNMRSPIDRSLDISGQTIQANSAGMSPLTRSSRDAGWRYGLS